MNELEYSAELNNLVLNSIQTYFYIVQMYPNTFGQLITESIKFIKKGSKTTTTLGVSDNSPLRNKELRNHLEHLDENLDKYLWSKPIVGNVIPAYVGQEMTRNEVPYHFFRAFFTESAVFESLGVRLELQPIVDELYEIYRKSENQDL